MTADLILTHARIYTLDGARPWAEAVACRDGRILAVGSDAGIRALVGPETRVIDCGGLTDPADVRERVAAAVAAAAPGEWVIGWGWDSYQWNTQPTAALIDDLSPDNPVVLARMDMHTWWANSRAMEQAGISAGTPDPIEASIGRYPDGRPTGLFSEWNAIDLIERHMPRPDAAALSIMLQEAIAEAHRLGLTGIHDQRVEREGAESLRLFQTLRRAGQLALRVHANVAADFLPEAVQLGLESGFGDDILWLGH
ncbi:MAG TPA: amidohydrolase family protein, partial [Promineifilum sp.]|nr:amidohydrolase family protein [Promineifilum sp.]